MRVLPPEAFAHVFEPLCGKRVGFVRPRGNVGDDLIEAATFQLFDVYGIRWTLVDPTGPVEADELVFGGGGNMGSLYPENAAIRKQCLEMGLPLTILPQSFTSREDLPFRRVYVRERASWAFCEHARLAPDLALGLEYTRGAPPRRRVGVFLRRDKEGIQPRHWRTRDPIKACRTPDQYLALAAKYETIITDRLHFAICGLIVGRHTTLLPNSYHKNRSMYATWLARLGCHFGLTVRDALVGALAQDNRYGKTVAYRRRATRSA